jgi:hypothetical protein
METEGFDLKEARSLLESVGRTLPRIRDEYKPGIYTSKMITVQRYLQLIDFLEYKERLKEFPREYGPFKKNVDKLRDLREVLSGLGVEF